MGLLSWLFGDAGPVRRKMTADWVNRVLGVWRPYEGEDCLPRSRLPLLLKVPASWSSPRLRSEQCLFCEGLFDYWLRVNTALARYLAAEARSGRMYRLHYRERKGKAPREIAEPGPPLKFVQRRILQRLLSQMDLHPAAHGFVPGRSIFTHAANHCGRDVVVALDLRDFFPSITYARVTGFFKSSGIDVRTSTLLAGLCCREGRLPQGAPTSPMLSNLICRRLDARLDGLVRKHDGVYTRYADDLAISGPTALIAILPLVRRIIRDEGFALAPEKVRIMRRGSRQTVTGLVVNDKVGVPRRVRRTLRAMVHRTSKNAEPDSALVSYILGFVSFMRPAHQHEADRLAEQLGVYR